MNVLVYSRRQFDLGQRDTSGELGKTVDILDFSEEFGTVGTCSMVCREANQELAV